MEIFILENNGHYIYKCCLFWNCPIVVRLIEQVLNQNEVVGCALDHNDAVAMLCLPIGSRNNLLYCAQTSASS